MDFQNRPGAKTGGGGAATQGMADRWSFLCLLSPSPSSGWLQVFIWNCLFSRERRERLAALAAETIDLAKVPNQTCINHTVEYI